MASDERDRLPDVWATKLQRLAVPIIGPAVGIVLGIMAVTAMAAASWCWPGDWAQRNASAAALTVGMPAAAGFWAELILRGLDWIRCDKKNRVHRQRDPAVVARAEREAAAMLAAIGVVLVGAVIGGVGGHRFWLWRDIQIIPRGWDPDSLRQAHEAVGAGVGFFICVVILIVCMCKRATPRAQHQI
jgi:hypothetical protein